MLFHEPATATTWLYDYPASERPWLIGGSLLYTRAFWQRSPFPDIQVGEGHALPLGPAARAERGPA